MSAVFETYFSLAEIAGRIPKSPDFWRAEVKRGAFGPSCVCIGGEYFVAASGVAAYLDAHRIGAGVLSVLVNGRVRQPVAPRLEPGAGTVARSPGELARKARVFVQASGQGDSPEVQHG